jgi:hypothetical protein
MTEKTVKHAFYAFLVLAGAALYVAVLPTKPVSPQCIYGSSEALFTSCKRVAVR